MGVNGEPATDELSDIGIDVRETEPEEENEAFRAIGYTIGLMMLGPAKSSGGIQSINVARGWNAKIKDRMDLTLECIRCYYLAEPSPMTPVLEANADFFALFGDFRGFVRHYLLQDTLIDDFTAVKFLTSFDNFESQLVPSDIESYLKYKRGTIGFIHARNQRIWNLSDSFSRNPWRLDYVVLDMPRQFVTIKIRQSNKCLWSSRGIHCGRFEP